MPTVETSAEWNMRSFVPSWSQQHVHVGSVPSGPNNLRLGDEKQEGMERRAQKKMESRIRHTVQCVHCCDEFCVLRSHSIVLWFGSFSALRLWSFQGSARPIRSEYCTSNVSIKVDNCIAYKCVACCCSCLLPRSCSYL